MAIAPEDEDIAVELEGEVAAEVLWIPRPDDLACAVEQVGASIAGEPETYLHVHAIEGMLRYATEYPDVETGGLLVGDVCRDEAGGYVKVIAAVPARRADQAATTLTFTQDAWAAMHEERARSFPHHRVVGWYHTHPGMCVFLSAPDQFIQYHFFKDPRQVAVVIDPKKLEWGVFRWQDDRLELAQRFFVYGENSEDGADLPQALESLGPQIEFL